MRMRKKKNGDARIEACAHLLCRDIDIIKNDPTAPFGNKNPIHLEIGCGKGSFINALSDREKNVNFYALEMIPDAIVHALEKAVQKEDSSNIRFIIANAKNLTEMFPPHSIERIYLNFSDPWPKSRHAKRRLTYRTFLEMYKSLLTEDGSLYFKTDNIDLFEFSLVEFEEFGAKIDFVSRDLHSSELAESNIMTEYERNFSEKGFKINCAHIHF